MPGIQAVVFDLDGTLLDSLKDIATAANRSLDEKGFPTHLPEQYARFVGDGIRQMVCRILPVSMRNESIVDEMLKRVRRHYNSTWKCNTRPYPGIHELLDCLQKRDVQLAVLSNKPQEIMASQLSWFFPKAGFHVIAGARQGIPLKPDPGALLSVLQRMDCPPGSAMMLGDTAVDMQVARAAGAIAVGALWGFRDRQELLAAGADHLVAKPAEISALMD